MSDPGCDATIQTFRYQEASRHCPVFGSADIRTPGVTTEPDLVTEI